MHEEDSDYITEEEAEAESNIFLAYFDTDGFEGIMNVTESKMDLAHDLLVNGESTKPDASKVYGMMTMRARFNPQRFPEIWTFRVSPGITEEHVREMAESNPQYLADFVRKNGTQLYGSKPEKRRIN
jgi:hypothetical protein